MTRRANKRNGMRIEETVVNASGLYTVAEAAAFAKIPVPTLNYWLFGNKGHTPLRPPTIAKEDGKFITFMDFVEALAIRTLRNSYGFSLQNIRGAVEEAKQSYGIEYPFANQHHRTIISGGELHIIFGDDPNPVQISGNPKHQKSFRPVIEEFMEDMKFDEQKLAISYTAYRYLPPPQPESDTTVSLPTIQPKIINIVMNPNYCFGEPIVEGTCHRAETLWKSAKAEGAIEKAALYYEVPIDAVRAAFRFCEDIKMAA